MTLFLDNGVAVMLDIVSGFWVKVPNYWVLRDGSGLDRYVLLPDPKLVMAYSMVLDSKHRRTLLRDWYDVADVQNVDIIMCWKLTLAAC